MRRFRLPLNKRALPEEPVKRRALFVFFYAAKG